MTCAKFLVALCFVDFEAAQAKQPAFEPGVCARRLMEYMCHQRHRPQVSSFAGDDSDIER